MSAYSRLLCINLAIFWLLLSGFWDNGLLISLGIASIILVVYLSWRIERRYPIHSFNRVIIKLPLYWLWLVVEVVKSNISVVKQIWFPKQYPISPTLEELPLPQSTRLGKTMYANSITLTPGTVSVRILKGGKILVHALSKETMADLKTGTMSKKITDLEGEN